MIGQEIRKRRKNLGMTQRDLANMLNVKPNTLCQYETGKSEVSVHSLRKIAHVLNCSVVEIAFEELGLQTTEDGHFTQNNIEFVVKGASHYNIQNANKRMDAIDRDIVLLVCELEMPVKEKILSYVKDQKIIADHFKSLR